MNSCRPRPGWPWLPAGALTPARAAAQSNLPKLPNVRKSQYSTSETPNSFDDITTYNNFYEFGTDKDDPAANARRFVTRPWTIRVDGLVDKPGTYDLDSFIKPYALEERIYRLRCVEAWSIIVPWVGIPLADVIKRMEPQPRAKFVEFTTLYDPTRMPGQRVPILRWPYVEGLRMDEAMNPLTILAVGLYWSVLPNQDGAPIRLVVPLEVRLQEHQVDRAHPFPGSAAAQHVADRRAQRVRLLREREPDGRSSTLEPGHRASSRGIPSPPDPHVQRVRRAGRVHVYRHGSAQGVLTPVALKRIDLLKRVIFAAALGPAAWLAYGGYTGNLSANPIDYITDWTGWTALAFLTISLTVTPLRRLTGRNEIIRLRRMLGLFAFFYACLHLLTWAVIDLFFDLPRMVEDIVKRPFITIGMATFLLLLPLAVTSNAAMMRRLGKRWQQLHRLAYVAAITAVIHFWWGIKADFREPRLWALAVSVLFGFRAW